jgi:hypothetical protein
MFLQQFAEEIEVVKSLATEPANRVTSRHLVRSGRGNHTNYRAAHNIIQYIYCLNNNVTMVYNPENLLKLPVSIPWCWY